MKPLTPTARRLNKVGGADLWRHFTIDMDGFVE